MRRTEDVITIGQARLVAATLLARDPAAVPFNRRSLYAAALSWADGDTTWADANCGVGVEPVCTENSNPDVLMVKPARGSGVNE